MRGLTAFVLLGSTALAFPTILDPISAVSKAIEFAQGSVSNEYVEIDTEFYDQSTRGYRKKCVLHPVKEGEGFDDDNFMYAVKECGNGGIIRLPDAN